MTIEWSREWKAYKVDPVTTIERLYLSKGVTVERYCVTFKPLSINLSRAKQHRKHTTFVCCNKLNNRTDDSGTASRLVCSTRHHAWDENTMTSLKTRRQRMRKQSVVWVAGRLGWVMPLSRIERDFFGRIISLKSNYDSRSLAASRAVVSCSVYTIRPLYSWIIYSYIQCLRSLNVFSLYCKSLMTASVVSLAESCAHVTLSRDPV